MKLTAVAGLLLLGLCVASANKLWEKEDQEVMKSLENADEENAKVEKEEVEKGANTYLSTYMYTQYKTWVHSGAQNINGQQTNWVSSFISTWTTSLTSTFIQYVGEPTYFTTTHAYTTTFATFVTANPPPPPIVTATGDFDISSSGWSIDGENTWDEEFHVEKCGCEGEAPKANEWAFEQLQKFDGAIKGLREEVTAWFSANKVVGRWWLDKAFDDIYEVFGQWALQLQTHRRNYIRFGGASFQASYGGSVGDLLNNLVGQVRTRLQLRIQEGQQFLVWQQNSGAYQSQINALIGYRPRFHLRYNLIFANNWRHLHNVRFGAFLAGLHRQAWAWYQPRAGVLGWWWNSYRLFVNTGFKQYSNLAGIWFNGIKTRGFGWFRRVGLRRWNIAFNRFQVKFGRLHAHLMLKSNAAFGLNFHGGFGHLHILKFQKLFGSLNVHINNFGLRLFNGLHGHFNRFWRLRLPRINIRPNIQVRPFGFHLGLPNLQLQVPRVQVHVQPPVIQVQPPRHCGLLGRLFRKC